jgi:hypothetical protein
LDDPISKITKAKWIGGVVHIVECLPSKHKVLSSNSTTSNNKKQEASVLNSIYLWDSKKGVFAEIPLGKAVTVL